MRRSGCALLVGLAFVLPAVLGRFASAAEEIVPPDIVSRSQWKALPAKVALMKKQTVMTGIIIHHTDTAQSPQRSLEQKLKNLQDFSQRPGVLSGTGHRKPEWGDVPYHYYIDVSGRIGEGRSVTFAGDTNTGYDTMGFVQIVVEGKFEKEKPSAAQLASLEALVRWLKQSNRIEAKKITAHNDHAASDCPGRNLKPFVVQLRQRLSEAQPIEAPAGMAGEPEKARDAGQKPEGKDPGAQEPGKP